MHGYDPPNGASDLKFPHHLIEIIYVDFGYAALEASSHYGFFIFPYYLADALLMRLFIAANQLLGLQIVEIQRANLIAHNHEFALVINFAGPYSIFMLAVTVYFPHHCAAILIYA